MKYTTQSLGNIRFQLRSSQQILQRLFKKYYKTQLSQQNSETSKEVALFVEVMIHNNFVLPVIPAPAKTMDARFPGNTGPALALPRENMRA